MLTSKRTMQIHKAGSGVDPAEYLTQGWLPINGKHLRQIQHKIAKKSYEDVRALIQDLRADIGLFSYVLREARTFVGEHAPENAIQQLEMVGLENLSTILSVTEGEVSMHSYSDMVKSQSLRLRHSLVSATTAEAIAEKVGLDPSAVSSTALLRQLGLNLVAWNYPRVYAKALAAMGSGKSDMETTLFKFLGFSPRQLALSLILPDEVKPEYKMGLGILEPGQDSEHYVSKEGMLTAKLCELGEAFAKINDPEHFPAEARNWKGVCGDINHYLGPKGLTVIKDLIGERFANCNDIAPRSMDFDFSPETNVGAANKVYGLTKMRANPDAEKCPEWMKDEFKEVYTKMLPNSVSTEALQYLVSQLVVKAGFKCGCLYLTDPKEQFLVPRLRIGNTALERYKSLGCDPFTRSDNPISDALHSNIPVKQQDTMLHGERVSHISGSIGNVEPGGVLYLEMGEELTSSYGSETMIYFKAIRHCLIDCLNLKPKKTII